MNTISIPISEYQRLTNELELLRNSDLLLKINHLVDLLFQDKYGLFMSDYTDDLTEYAINKNWTNETSVWDRI